MTSYDCKNNVLYLWHKYYGVAINRLVWKKKISNTSKQYGKLSISFQARSLVRTVVNPDFKSEVQKNQERFGATLNLQSSDTALFLNGIFFDMDLVDTMTILDSLRQEMRVLEGLHSSGNLNKLYQSWNYRKHLLKNQRLDSIIWTDDQRGTHDWPTTVPNIKSTNNNIGAIKILINYISCLSCYFWAKIIVK